MLECLFNNVAKLKAIKETHPTQMFSSEYCENFNKEFHLMSSRDMSMCDIA